MMHEIGVELQTALRAKGCPFSVVDGPEPTSTTTWGRERIVIEYGKDFTFGEVFSQHRNPTQVETMNVPAKVTIYAQSPKAGALLFEHRRRALVVVRMAKVALWKVLLARKNPPTMKSGSFVEPADLEKSEKPGGAVFEFTLSFMTGVPDLTWAGAGETEATIGAVTSTTTFLQSYAAVPTTPETACGA